jgi:hypothetical protein
MPGSFTTPTISATIAEGGSLTVTITPSSALGAATTVRWVIVPKGKTPISSSDFSSLTGGAGNDVFVLKTGGKDAVTDFASGDKIRVDTSAGNETTLTALRDAANLRWTNNTNEATDGTNDALINDTVIYDTKGTASTSDDVVIMVLEDFSTALSITNFDIV